MYMFIFRFHSCCGRNRSLRYELLTFHFAWLDLLNTKKAFDWTKKKRLISDNRRHWLNLNVVFVRPAVQIFYTYPYFFRCCLSWIDVFMHLCWNAVALAGWCVCTECNNIMLIYNIKQWISAPNFLVVNTDCLNSIYPKLIFSFCLKSWWTNAPKYAFDRKIHYMGT